MPAGEAANNTHFIVVGLIRDGSKSLKVKGDDAKNKNINNNNLALQFSTRKFSYC
jgi:hypothetical protein